ncbi:methyltransferase domain-containing protein [Pseudolabrys sp. FHR47]|uniref:class I SAM-dependent methyltransferase n=1 Tax=Pseudolabrys sp. FHR47 TaxID=2562284 RepID=UPI0010BE9DE3|nr:methyltransferase domain-containing protein [Pseudolabrys sp. FHR47]
MTKTLVQEQFGKTAAHYLTSKPHALGKSLERLVALTSPQKDWRVLDIATGGGHVAYTFAPHVARVWATDITQEMLDMVKLEAAKRGLGNIRTTYAKAEALPFDDASFDLVTCRIAPHHFDSIPDFLAEAHRVLKNGGTLAIVDNVVPEGPVGDYINAFERFRDPSHLRAWAMAEWRVAIKDAGFTLGHEEQIYKIMEFKSWAQRYDDTMKRLLRAMLTETTPAVKAALEPQDEGDAFTFRLCEGVFIAAKN